MEWQVHWKLYAGKLMELKQYRKVGNQTYGAMFSLVLVALAVSLVWINVHGEAAHSNWPRSHNCTRSWQVYIMAHSSHFRLCNFSATFSILASAKYNHSNPSATLSYSKNPILVNQVISVPSSDKHGDREENMEESLLPRERDEKKQGIAGPTPTQGVFIQEVKRLGCVAGPMVAVILTQNCLQIISIMMCGHLGELALSSTAMAISLSTVTGFSLMVTHPYYYS
ncbi:PROTEIN DETOXIFICATION [Salix koriyanagi]|uniref:PROTEIN DETOXIFICATION n=1 Tax=Salix koriyanagi TaxID=2511006 RepID=A0A9Q1AEY0_9ROSI|nr:PROTEIN DETOXIFICATION [Salix koriyanagi]